VELDVVSQSDFNDLKNRFEALLHSLKREEKHCPGATGNYNSHPGLSYAGKCEKCAGTNIVFVKRESED
jgi:hypothetical protein